jgi:FMN phosphatase YigB (HAD superfamily)
MVSKNRIKSLGFDLDGVLIDKPPIVPKFALEALYGARANNGIKYRFPTTKFEKCIRWLSHAPILRPPIKVNVEYIKTLSKNKNYKLYIVSSRYSFLEDRTYRWLERNGIYSSFEEIYLNKEDKQPHVFKEEVLKKLKPDIYVDDDPLLSKYLKKKLSKTKIIHVDFKEDVGKLLDT